MIGNNLSKQFWLLQADGEMLTSTFCGMGGLGPEAERVLWSRGILTWNDYKYEGSSFFSPERHRRILSDIERAEREYRNGFQGLYWFFKQLPLSHRCRLRPHILDRLIYLDIETTGLDFNDRVTMVTLSNGDWRRTFINGIDLDQCVSYLKEDVFFVTFNGHSFDIPRLRRAVSLPLRQPNLDLKQLLKHRGITGGQKHIESIFGIRRASVISSCTGQDAVQLWSRYQEGDKQALTLLTLYNQEDVKGLEKLFCILYNESMKGFPFT